MSRYWVIDEEKTEPHLLVVNSYYGFEYRAIVKWDGCIHFESYCNGERTEENRSYIHYCNIDDEIRRLLDLRRQAKRFFGKDWK